MTTSILGIANGSRDTSMSYSIGKANAKSAEDTAQNMNNDRDMGMLGVEVEHAERASDDTGTMEDFTALLHLDFGTEVEETEKVSYENPEAERRIDGFGAADVRSQHEAPSKSPPYLGSHCSSVSVSIVLPQRRGSRRSISQRLAL